MKQELELKGWDMVTKERNSDKRIVKETKMKITMSGIKMD